MCRQKPNEFPTHRTTSSTPHPRQFLPLNFHPIGTPIVSIINISIISIYKSRNRRACEYPENPLNHNKTNTQHHGKLCWEDFHSSTGNPLVLVKPPNPTSIPHEVDTPCEKLPFKDRGFSCHNSVTIDPLHRDGIRGYSHIHRLFPSF